MWYFYCPIIQYGENALSFLENIPGERCFIVTDEVLVKLGYVKKLTDKLDEFGKNYEISTDVKPDPHEDDVLIAKKKCLDYSPNLIIGLGGGSVIDTAKVVYALYEMPEITLDDIFPMNPELHKMGKKSKLIAIPTTSGTGAETTNVSVVSRFLDNIWKKHFFLHLSIMPSIAIVDPIFPAGMPPKLTIDTAFDALAHALEGMSSLWKNEWVYAVGLKAIELIYKYLPIALKDPNNMEARDYMHQAASLGGLAMGNSQAHLGHNLGHSFGSVFHVPHGRAVGMFLPYTTQFVINNPDGTDTVDTFAKLAKQLGWAKWDDDNKKAANIVVDKIKELQKEIGFPMNLKENGTSKEDLENNLEVLVNLGFEDSTGVLSPRSANSEELRNLYRYAFEGKNVDF